MKISKRYIKTVLSKRFIELLIMGSIGFLLIFVSYLSSITLGIGTLSLERGTLYHKDGKWCIDYTPPIPILNPEDFPHILIPENDGKEVHYAALYPTPWFYSGTGQSLTYIIFLDTIQQFIIKQNIIFSFVCIISSVILIYLIRNYKIFLIINTPKKQKIKPVVKKTFNNLIYENHYM